MTPANQSGYLSGETKTHSEVMTYRTSAAWPFADCHPEVEQEMEAGSCEPRLDQSIRLSASETKTHSEVMTYRTSLHGHSLIAILRLNRKWRQVHVNHDSTNQSGCLLGETKTHSEVMTYRTSLHGHSLIAIPRLNRKWRQVHVNHDPANQSGYLSGELQIRSDAMTCRTSAAWSR